jgi:hypothetical protein
MRRSMLSRTSTVIAGDSVLPTMVRAGCVTIAK